MSEYANPFGGTADDAARYVRAMLDLLGDDPPLEVLAAGPVELARAVDAASPRIRRFRERERAWCIDEVVHHLADAEIVYAGRYRRILCEDDPEVPGFDQDIWAQRLGYGTREARRAVELFARLREVNLDLLRPLGAAEWARTGRHERRGRETLARVVALAAAHDRVHLRQIARIRARAEHEG